MARWLRFSTLWIFNLFSPFGSLALGNLESAFLFKWRFFGTATGHSARWWIWNGVHIDVHHFFFPQWTAIRLKAPIDYTCLVWARCLLNIVKIKSKSFVKDFPFQIRIQMKVLSGGTNRTMTNIVANIGDICITIAAHKRMAKWMTAYSRWRKQRMHFSLLIFNLCPAIFVS